jgi:hypothetical protein
LGVAPLEVINPFIPFLKLGEQGLVWFHDSTLPATGNGWDAMARTPAMPMLGKSSSAWDGNP